MSCPSVFDGIGQQIVKYDRDDIRIEIDIFLYRFHFDIDSYMLILIQLLISQSYFCNQFAQVAFTHSQLSVLSFGLAEFHQLVDKIEQLHGTAVGIAFAWRDARLFTYLAWAV